MATRKQAAPSTQTKTNTRTRTAPAVASNTASNNANGQPTTDNEQSTDHPYGRELLSPDEQAAQNGDRTLPVGDRRVLNGRQVAPCNDQESQREQAADEEEGYCPHPVGGGEGGNAVPRTQDDGHDQRRAGGPEEVPDTAYNRVHVLAIAVEEHRQAVEDS